MAIRPGDRYATRSALADDIERWMADRPVAAWRERYRGERGDSTHERQPNCGDPHAASSVLVALVGSAAVLIVQTRGQWPAPAGQQQARNTQRSRAAAVQSGDGRDQALSTANKARTC